MYCPHPVCFGHHNDSSNRQSHVVYARVGQSSRRLEQDVGFDNIAGSASQQSLHLPTQLHLPPEVDFIGSNPGSKANSESTDSTEYGGSPRTAASRPVPQVIRARATASVPDTSRPRCPSAPTSAEIRGNLTFLDDLPTPRERDVTATTAASTGELYYSASLADASAPETSADPFEATDASVVTVYPRDRSPACAPAASALPSGGGSDSRQGRTEDEVSVCRCGRLNAHGIYHTSDDVSPLYDIKSKDDIGLIRSQPYL